MTPYRIILSIASALLFVLLALTIHEPPGPSRTAPRDLRGHARPSEQPAEAAPVDAEREILPASANFVIRAVDLQGSAVDVTLLRSPRGQGLTTPEWSREALLPGVVTISEEELSAAPSDSVHYLWNTGFQPMPVSFDRLEQTVTMHRGQTATFRCVMADTKEPVHGALVVIGNHNDMRHLRRIACEAALDASAPSRWRPGPNLNRYLRAGVTDNEGLVSFGGLPEGSCRVTALHGDYSLVAASQGLGSVWIPGPMVTLEWAETWCAVVEVDDPSRLVTHALKYRQGDFMATSTARTHDYARLGLEARFPEAICRFSGIPKRSNVPHSRPPSIELHLFVKDHGWTTRQVELSRSTHVKNAIRIELPSKSSRVTSQFVWRSSSVANHPGAPKPRLRLRGNVDNRYIEILVEEGATTDIPCGNYEIECPNPFFASAADVPALVDIHHESHTLTVNHFLEVVPVVLEVVDANGADMGLLDVDLQVEGQPVGMRFERWNPSVAASQQPFGYDPCWWLPVGFYDLFVRSKDHVPVHLYVEASPPERGADRDVRRAVVQWRVVAQRRP